MTCEPHAPLHAARRSAGLLTTAQNWRSVSRGIGIGHHAIVMEMPEEVAIKALANGEPLEGAALNLTLATTRNGLSLLCRARTNAQGDVRLSGSDLKRWEAETRSLAMMDYGPLTGELHVAVVNRADIASRREGYRTWGAKYFHDDYIIWLDAVEATLQQVSPNTELRAVVGVSGGSVTALGSTRSA